MSAGVGVAVSVRSVTSVGWFFDSRFLQHTSWYLNAIALG